MGKTYPKLIIRPENIQHNVSQVVDIAKRAGLDITGVAKGFCGIPKAAQALIDAGCMNVGLSRTEQLRPIKEYNPDITTLLTRLPMKSEVDEIVTWADITLNSEIETMAALNEEALRQDKIHKVIIMKDIGDRREGYESEEEMIEACLKAEREFKGLELYGVGANYNCYGSVSPTKENLRDLVYVAEKVEKLIGRKLDIISVGGTTVLNLVDTGDIPERVNNLRCGIATITKAAYTWEEDIPDRKDSFRLQAEIIELKNKPTLPRGKHGFAALNEERKYEDLGIRKRAILAIGSQDIGVGGGTIEAVNPKIKIWGSSSDHTMIDIEDCDTDFKIGDIVEFNINYVACMNLSKGWDINIEIE